MRDFVKHRCGNFNNVNALGPKYSSIAKVAESSKTAELLHAN